MKILQLTNKNPHPPRDGGAIATLALARGLSCAGNEVTLLAMETSKHRNLSREIPDEPFRLIQVTVDTGVSLLRATINLLFSRLPYNAVRFNHAGYRKKLEEILHAENFDIIILENLYTFFFLDSIRKLSKGLVVMRAHNLEHEIWERNALLSIGIKRWYLSNLAQRIKKYELRQINQYDILIPITKRDGDLFDRYGNTKPLFVLNTGIDSSRIKSSPAVGVHRSVAHIGALDWIPNQKGLTWFMEAVWPQVSRTDPSLDFHLAGRNAPPEFVTNMIRSGAHYHGEVEDATGFIDAHSIMIVPLFSGSGMRIKLIEYLARGKPVITTPLGAEGLPVVHKQHLLVEEDPDKMATAILSLINDPQRSYELGINALAFVNEHFDNQQLVQYLSDFLLKRVNLHFPESKE